MRSRLIAHLVLAALSLSACNDTPRQADVSATAQSSDQIKTFLESYWNRPLAAQGPAPSRFTALEASLDPASCGSCHISQFNDWSQSLHSRAMGPGILGQLADMAPNATEEHQDCIRCHAPLREQADSLVASFQGGPQESVATQAIAGLHRHGLVCAACHVRGHQRYGPPRRDGASPDAIAQIPHNGWVVSAAFEDSRFCAACHQFRNNEYALNGKLLENTYKEWKASRHARDGRTCQSCHMPDRRHLWRGIHDPEMVKSGVSISVTPAKLVSGAVSAELVIVNNGTGHYFPTYVTPRVVAEAYQENVTGERVPGTLRDFVVSRQVPLDLSREIADTRIPPDQQAVFKYQAPLGPKANAVVFQVRVEPDAFYTRLYTFLLEEKQAGKGEKLIRQALQDSKASTFTIYASRQPLPGK